MTRHLFLRLPVWWLAVVYPLGVCATTVVPGGVYVWKIPGEVTEIAFQEKPVMHVAGTAFVGIPISHAPGAASLTYRIGTNQHTHKFTVIDKTYTEQHITLTDKAMVNPPPETLRRIRAESRRQGKLYNTFSETVDLSRGFVMPLAGITTSLYGHRRFFNGEPRSPHSGLDIAADAGTPVHATGAAVITLADKLYFNGNTLFLDHGQGLVTMYCHLSEMLVTQGDIVNQGQTVGLVGATGRATGPHLHWSTSLNGHRIDPGLFMQVLNAHMQPEDPN